MTITLNPSKVTRFFGKIILFLILADVAGIISRFYFHHEFVFGLVPLFDLDVEYNIPSYFSSALLLFCFILLWFIAWASLNEKKKDYWYWAGLRLIFLFLAIDEAMEIHESVIVPLRSLFHLSGIFYFAWVIPYGIFAGLIGVLYWKFMFKLPAGVRARMFIAAALYIFGALGFELISGSYCAITHEQTDLTFAIMALCEESLEMVGVLFFIYALLDYIGRELNHASASLTIIFASPKHSHGKR